MIDSIVHVGSGRYKGPATRFARPFGPGFATVLERLRALESGEDDALDDVDPIDDPVLDFLSPAQISAFYRRKFGLAEPGPAAAVGTT